MCVHIVVGTLARNRSIYFCVQMKNLARVEEELEHYKEENERMAVEFAKVTAQCEMAYEELSVSKYL